MEQILAFGNERFPIAPLASPEERETRSRITLARALNLRTVVAFIGSGCSAPLGYPVWRGLVTEIVKETINRVSFPPLLRARFEGIHARLALPASSVSTRSLMFYLSLCQQHLGKKGDADQLHDYIAEQIRKFEEGAKQHRDTDYDPYNVLKRLPIRRFVTTNYDHELSMMLGAKFDDHRKVKSFTQKSHDNLAGFAVVGLEELTDSIFHCHGRAAEPGTIVASEADYQEWYLTQRNATATTFRQSLDLVLSSNPVLFIGFGMEDDDLLRPLRVFHADDPERKDARLLFALSEYTDDPTDNDWMDSRYDRYGVNFLRYDRPTSNDSAERGRSLCKAIERLESEWDLYRDQWWQKPPIRKVSVTVAAHTGGDRPKKPYQHYSVRLSEKDELAPAKTKEDLDVLESYIQDASTRVVLVTGDGGSGKSWRVLNLLERVKNKPGRFKDGIFFWSSYYADDWLTGLDRALSYFERGESIRPRRLDRFRECLENGRHLVVFDGFERLLRETENSKTGVPYGRNVKELLDIIARHEKGKTRSTVILTTRLVPESFQQWMKGPGKHGDPIRHFGVRRLTTKDLRNSQAFKDLNEEDVGRICSLCGGHSYALLLAVHYLRPHDVDFAERFATFRREISRRAPDSRIPEIIKLAIGALDKDNEKLASRLLDRLSIFMSPIDSDTSQVCFEEAFEKMAAVPKTTTRKKVIDALLRSKLLLEVTTEPHDGENAQELVTVHPVVRSHIFYKSHGVVREVTPTFMLTGFTSGNLACHPGNARGRKHVEGLFDALCTRALASTSFETRRSLARAAFGVVRSRMESNSVPRWTSYDCYLRLGLRLLFLIKRIAWDRDKTKKEIWDYQDRALGNEKQNLNGILYSDELAWLYNDIGLALSSEGSMVDAYSLWEQGFEINRVTDSEEEGGQYMVQSHLHMAHLFIELGRLPRAAQFLATTARANAIYGDPDFAGRILGYRGLLAHLAGNVDEAEKLYEKALQKLAVKGRHNLRAESLFQRHWADLLLAKKEPAKAEERAEIALSMAREGDFPDLEAYARKARAHVWRVMDEKDPKAVRAEYMAAMQQAEKFGIRRLQADIHSELARLALQVGDWETSRIRAMESLKLANELGLGLRRTHGLIVLGMAMEAGGNRDLAVSYYEHAWAMSKLQGYHLRGREAEQQLLRLGRPVQELDNASSD
jgi:tetratricopeptide (TPR) repeat protein